MWCVPGGRGSKGTLAVMGAAGMWLSCKEVAVPRTRASMQAMWQHTRLSVTSSCLLQGLTSLSLF